MSVPVESRIGSELAGYRIDELVGRGGMGVVYRAHDLALERDVALKLLAPELAGDVAFRERFLRESRLAAALEHPNVVPIHDAGEIEGQLYLVMRLVDGTDLKAIVNDGPLPPARAVHLLEQVAAALDAAHARGLVHRDVKPSNVLATGDDHAYLADFGLTRRLSEQARGFDAGLSLGTPAYVAPEQIEGEPVDGRTDQYSLACVLHECLTGKPPFPRGSEAAVLFAHLEELPPAPPGLEHVLGRALAKEPEERYPTCGALIADARAALGLERRRARWPFAVAAVGLALIVAGVLAFVLRQPSAAPQAEGGRLIRIDPASNRVTSSVAVGDGPEAVAAAGGRVWVASYRDGELWQVDEKTGAATRIAAVGGRPFAITIHDGFAYVAALGLNQFTGTIAKLDAATGARVGGLERLACSIGSSPSAGVWVAGCPNVWKLAVDAATPRIRANIVVPYPGRLSAANFREALADLAVGEGGVWVVGDAADQRLWRIDPRRRSIAATIPLRFPPAAVAAGAGSVWVTDQLHDAVVRVDPASNRIVARMPVARGAAGVAVGAGSVWVAGAIDHAVSRIDPGTGRVVATIPVAASPQAVAVRDGSVWVVGDAR